MKSSISRLAVAAIAVSALAPSLASAQLGNVENLLEAIGRLVSLATPIVVGLALLAFFWGLVKYIFAAGNDDSKKAAIHLMVGGIVAIFIIVSLVGIIKFIGNALGVGQGGTLDVPEVEGV
jgi:hypothetical protein